MSYGKLYKWVEQLKHDQTFVADEHRPVEVLTPVPVFYNFLEARRSIKSRPTYYSDEMCIRDSLDTGWYFFGIIMPQRNVKKFSPVCSHDFGVVSLVIASATPDGCQIHFFCVNLSERFGIRRVQVFPIRYFLQLYMQRKKQQQINVKICISKSYICLLYTSRCV